VRCPSQTQQQRFFYITPFIVFDYSLSLSKPKTITVFILLLCAEGFLKLSLEMDETVLDDIIRKLVSAKNGRTTKQVHLTEADIRQLCSSAKEIFLSQPNLLELEAPIKICGNFFFLIRFLFSFLQLFLLIIIIHCL
jgi:hypothetical protein